MMTSPLKTCYLFIGGNYSGIHKFSLGILIITIHTIHARKIVEYEKGNNYVTHIFSFEYYIPRDIIKTNYICNIVDLISTQNV